MTSPKPPPIGTIPAAEDLAEQVAEVAEVCPDCDLLAVGEVLAALLAGGHIHEEWGARYHAGDPDGDVDTWRDTRAKAEAMLASRVKGGWREPSTLIRRFVIITAAVEVPK